MEGIEFAKLVAEMRHLQKEYFRTRNSSLLQHAKIKEQEVDKIIAKLFPKEVDQQKTLFS